MIFKKWENWLTYEITAGTFVNQGFHVAWFSQQIRLPCLCLSIKLNCEENKIRFHAKCYLRIFFFFNSAGYDLQKIQLKKSNGNFHSSSSPVYIFWAGLLEAFLLPFRDIWSVLKDGSILNFNILGNVKESLIPLKEFDGNDLACQILIPIS